MSITLGGRSLGCVVGGMLEACGVGSTHGEQAVGCMLGAVVGTTFGAQGMVRTVWLLGNFIGAPVIAGAGSETVGTKVWGCAIIGG